MLGLKLMDRSLVHLFYVHALLWLLLTGGSLQCGPGRGHRSPHRRRKMTPLVFKQHVPNVSENTLGASGLAEGRITRSDSKFKDLVVNYNPDIIFKDEEGTGADRIMSQRCKDKLNTLAISVMNRWPNMKLRVTEAWDEDNHHAKDSLHYEGRAVDVTTSDRDRSKYGVLARLAVEAGFDWVYYESRGHIHLSVKSDSSIAIYTGGCFPPASLARLETGIVKPVSELVVGDSVLTTDARGQLVYSEIILFLDRERSTRAAFYTIHTDNGNNISLTPSHMIYAGNSRDLKLNEVEPIFAQDVVEGQYVYTVVDESVEISRVARISVRTEVGYHAPLTKHGTIVVDDVIASCYARINSQTLAHISFAPVRMLRYFSELLWEHDTSWHLLFGTSQNKDGVHWYAKFLQGVAHYVIPDSQWYHL